MATPTIFISYRREDTVGHAGRIYDRLVEKFGKEHVYRDIDTISAGEDFVQAVREKINRSDTLLALIGPRWLTSADEEGRWRLADENDLVRVEIAAALDRNIRVIPVLLQGAAIPKAKDLPGELARLAQRNAVEIRDTNFDLDTSLLIDKLLPSWQNRLSRIFSRWPVYVVITLLLASLLGFWIYPQVALTPEKARIQIVQMGMQFDAATFVDRAENNDMQAVDLFLRAGMKPDAENDKKQSALKMAAANGHLELVKKLVDNGDNIDAALPWAAGHGQKQVLDFMLGKNPGQIALNKAFYSSAGTEYTEIVQLLLEKGADVNFINNDEDSDASSFGATALARAASMSSVENIRLLLSKGADVNARVDGSIPSALFAATSGSFRSINSDLVDLLLAHGADVNVKDNTDSTPLHEAIRAGSSYGEVEPQRLKIVQSLLDKGADLTGRAKWMESWQPTPLLLAIHQDKPQIALLLIERGANVNDLSGDTGGYFSLTALMKAADKGMADVVKALLVKGADVSARNEKGDSALLIAAESPRGEQVLSILLANGADARATNDEGVTVLMKTAGSPYTSMGEDLMRELIKAGAQVNAVDNNHWTALMYAAYSGRTDLAQLLLKQGADKTMTNDEGDTALVIATKQGYKKIVNLLNPH